MSRLEEIRSIEIDFDNNILKVNGNSLTDRPVIVYLPGPDGWSIKKVFNIELASGGPEGCDRLEVTYVGVINNKLS